MLIHHPHPSFKISHCFPNLSILLSIRALNRSVSDDGVVDWRLEGEDWDWMREDWDCIREDWDRIREEELRKVGGGVPADRGSRFQRVRSPVLRMRSKRKSWRRFTFLPGIILPQIDSSVFSPFSQF